MLSRLCLLCVVLLTGACTTDPKQLFDSDVRNASTPLAETLHDAVQQAKAEPLQLDPGRAPQYQITQHEPRVMLHGLPSNYRAFRLSLREGQLYNLQVVSDCVSCSGHAKYGLKPALFLLDEQGELIDDQPSHALAGIRGVSLRMSGVAPRDGEYFLLVVADNRALGYEIVLDNVPTARHPSIPLIAVNDRRRSPMRSYPIGEIRAFASSRL